ncbi:MAG: substrate-binding domain-containing protein [Anaerolineae bacterium]|nr:substrate-binding domain-containing protein [Anaerolineae bacterium]
MANNSKRIRPRIGVLAGWQVYGGTLDTFLRHVFRGILAAADDRKCDLLLACGIGQSRDISLGRPAWPVLLPEANFVPVGPWNADGLIVATPLASQAGSDYLRQLGDNGYPVIFAGTGEPGPSVIVDNEGGIHQAVSHLVEHGHRRIAFIAGHEQPVQGDSSRRLAAYRAAVQEWRLASEPDLIAYGSHTNTGGRQAMQQILGKGTPFTAVLASNDESAIGAMAALRDANILVPQDVAVIGFDDRLEASAQSPPLTTVRHPMFELGYRALTLLLEYLDGTTDGQRIVRVPTRFIVRESCGCLPGTSDRAGSPTLINRAGFDRKHRQKTPEGRLVETMVQAVSAEMHRLSADEAYHLCQRITQALISSLKQDDLDILLEVMQQILRHTISLGSDPHVWQAPISLLREGISIVLEMAACPDARQKAQDALDQARIAIGESAREQHTRHLIRQADIAYRLGQMTARFHAAQQEAEIYSTLALSLPNVGIAHAIVTFYEPQGEDPVAWSVLQSKVDPDDRRLARFPSRTFPPQGLYPEDKPLSIALLPLLIQGELRGFVALDTGNLEICSDIVRQLASALRTIWLYHEAVKGQRLAEEANRLKGRFLSVVSHELRTPLNLIAGLSDMLLQEGHEIAPGKFQVNREDIEQVYINAQHLDSLIRDVLDLAQSEAGQLKLVREPLDLSDVLQSVSIIGTHLARNKGLTWQYQVSPDLPYVWGDRTRLRQVILNLINNAVKFTAQGGEITLTATGERDRVTVAVQDTGLGIPVKEQQVIFDEFRQSERTTARGYGGLGLGLAICKRLVEMHGGKIGVHSLGGIGTGSRFYFTLPAMEQHPVHSRSEISPTQAERIVLLVDDAEAGGPLKAHLTQRGFDVELVAANETNDWLSWLLVEPPDAVVLDLGLTSTHGWETLKILKENPATKDISVLFASITDEPDSGAILEMDYLTKPVSSVALSKALHRQGLTGDTKNKQIRKILIVDDEPSVLDMHARILAAQLPDCLVLCAHDGQEALQIIRRERLDLVLLDLMMPELDGFGVLEAMHEHEMSRNVPVIVLTGQALTREDMSRLNRGVTSVLEKGLLSTEETLVHIEAALEQNRELGSDARQIARRAMAFIHTHYTEPISRADVAFDIGVSERHLARCFKEEVGLTVGVYLNRYRVRQAKHLLQASNKSITEVAIEIGFSSNSYFSQVFRQETGLSPSTFRRKMSPNQQTMSEK